MSRTPGHERPSAFAAQVDALRDALRANPCAPEQPHERSLRVAMATAGFASEVVAAWHAQALHRGHRARYRLTEEHYTYASAVLAWSLWKADVARWVAQVGPEQAADPDAQGRPAKPGSANPDSMHAPPHWPAHPERAGAVLAFFAAL